MIWQSVLRRFETVIDDVTLIQNHTHDPPTLRPFIHVETRRNGLPKHVLKRSDVDTFLRAPQDDNVDLVCCVQELGKIDVLMLWGENEE